MRWALNTCPLGNLKNPPVLWLQETRRIIEATAPAPRLAMAASVVRDSITWPQSSISHETAQFGRFTDLHVMPRISKNEAPPNALRTRQPQPKPPGNEIFWSLSGTSTAPPPHYCVDLPIDRGKPVASGRWYYGVNCDTCSDPHSRHRYRHVLLTISWPHVN